jgi:glutamine amidotransferase
MGWNQVQVEQAAPPCLGLAPGSSVYFVHSYHVIPADPGIVSLRTDYGGPFVSAIWRDNVFATQFHPEKSQQVGQEMLRRFAAWAP